MTDSPAYYTVVGYADLHDGVETFTEVVYCLRADAWLVAVAQSMGSDPSRDMIRQATEINTFMGICVDAYSGSVALPSTDGPDLKIDPDTADLIDLEVYIRTTPGEFEISPPVRVYHWYDTECDEAEAESYGFDTYALALEDRYDQV